MHESSYEAMSLLIDKYLDKTCPYSILELGSRMIGHDPLNYKDLFINAPWKYVGADIQEGDNVDIVLTNTYSWNIDPDTYDVVISGQTFEHIPYFWLTWKEMVRVTKPGGYLFIIAPSKGKEHRYPVDCWRFFKDGMIALGELENVVILEATTDYKKDHKWGDTVAAFQKPGGNNG